MNLLVIEDTVISLWNRDSSSESSIENSYCIIISMLDSILNVIPGFEYFN